MCPCCWRSVPVPDGVSPELHQQRLILLAWLVLRRKQLVLTEIEAMLASARATERSSR